MRSSSARLACVSLIILVAVAPVAAQTGQRRGADLVVTRLDGTRVSGELIAVKPDSILLLDRATDVSVGLADIRSVRIVRRSPIILLTVAGFLAASGTVGLISEPAEEWGWFMAGLASVGGGIAGLASGLISDRDRRPDLVTGPGAPPGSLDGLKRFSREGRLSDASAPFRRPRFRLGLATTMGSFSDAWRVVRATEVSWSFAQAVPPEEAGPWTTTFYQRLHEGENLATAGPVSLGFEWSDRWAAEIELFLWARGRDIFLDAAPSFVATADGRTYTGFEALGQRANIDYVLASLAYRPFSFGRRGGLEVGIAAGPAWVKLGPDGSLLPGERKTVPVWRVQALYDFRFTEWLSLGVYAGYRHCEARFDASSVTLDLTFRDWNGGIDPVELTRRIEIGVPVREFSASRFIYGLRFGFRI